MKTIYHQRITEEALGRYVSRRAADAIIAANIGQDAMRYQFFHDHYHYDSNAFTRSDAYVEQQRGMISSGLMDKNPLASWQAFGRLSHTVQDLYAHSNYVSLWLAQYPEPDPRPEHIDPLDPGILASPELRSGKPHLLDLLIFFNILSPSWENRAPVDSHTRMNIDGPDRPNFAFAFAAAVKRTQIEYFRVVNALPAELASPFTDL